MEWEIYTHTVHACILYVCIYTYTFGWAVFEVPVNIGCIIIVDVVKEGWIG